ncbi:hypothetical protein [Thioalkalivibrio sp. ALJ1]|uniref:hypothetical protein n=1 Tax=Thioalkalivibrio sp. ALJ1 TaxID=1158144 RepID=UPI0012E0037E|nr:hypothetical protein [Thioalkalivibrio sp. ALJ1]
MGLIPGYCKDCGARFVSQAMSVDDTSTVILENTRVTCPNSPNHRAYLLDGVFTGAGELVKLVSGPDFSFDVLREITELLETARAQRKSLEEAADTAERMYPGFGRILKRFQNLGYAVAFFGLLSAEINVNLNIDIDVNQLVEQAMELWNEQESSEVVKDADKSEDSKHDSD